ncbi:MAG: glycosyltransferase [Lachnospiraceae bacterium]
MQALIDSITAQTYGNFELCLADGSTDGKTAAFVERRYGSDPRIRLKRLEVNGVFPRIPMLPSVWPPASF